MQYPQTSDRQAESDAENLHQQDAEYDLATMQLDPGPLDAVDNEPETAEPTRRRWRGLGIGLGLLALLAAGGMGWQWWQQRSAQPEAQQAAATQPQGVPVKLAPVEVTTIQDSSEFVGTLEAPQSAVVRTELDGRLSEIYAAEGEFVERGDAIARIESKNMQAQLMQARANQLGAEARLRDLEAGSRPEEIAKARASLAEAQARLAQAQAGTRPEEIAQAQARVESARAEADLTSKRVDRYQSLRSEGAIAQDRLDEVLQQDRTAQADLREAQRELDQLRNGTRSEEIAQLEAAAEQQRQTLRQLENGTRPEEIAQAEAQVAEAIAEVRAYEVQLEDALVTAPFAGTIGDIPVKLGDYLQKGDELTTVTQNQSLDLNLSIPLEKANQLSLGMPVQLQDPQGQSLGTGRVSFVSPQVNQNSQTVLAKATFDNPEGQLRNGQFVRAEVIWQQRNNTVVVPTTAVVFQGEQRFLYVAEGQDALVAKRVPVQLGLVLGDRAEVISGLEPGDRIITSGMQKLADGAPIMPMPTEGQPQNPAAPKPATAPQN